LASVVSYFSVSVAVLIAAVGYGVIWMALATSNLVAGIIGGALLGGGVAVGLLGR
jgi:hypothetical protein